MKTTLIINPKNYKDSKFSYPKVKRNKTKSKQKTNSIDNKENLNPDDFWNDCIKKNDSAPVNRFLDFLSGKKDNSIDKNNLNIFLNTPGFYLDKGITFETSSMKKNKIKFASYNKVAEYRYAEDENKENEINNINNVFPNVGVYEKFNINNNYLYKNNDHSFSDVSINQKLNFEIIKEDNVNENKRKPLENLNGFDNNKLFMNKQKRETSERLTLLYEKGKIKNEVNRLLAEKIENMKEKKELSKCTFFPETNKRTHLADKFNNQVEGNFYERLDNWQNKVNRKKKRPPQAPKDEKEYTYKPQITEKNLNKVFSNKSILNDPSSRGYIIKQEKARIESEEKRKRVYWSCRGSLIKQTTHYSNSNTIAHCLTTKEDNLNNSILDQNDENSKNNIRVFTLEDFKDTVRNELKNIDALTIETESNVDE